MSSFGGPTSLKRQRPALVHVGRTADESTLLRLSYDHKMPWPGFEPGRVTAAPPPGWRVYQFHHRGRSNLRGPTRGPTGLVHPRITVPRYALPSQTSAPCERRVEPGRGCAPRPLPAPSLSLTVGSWSCGRIETRSSSRACGTCGLGSPVYTPSRGLTTTGPASPRTSR